MKRLSTLLLLLLLTGCIHRRTPLFPSDAYIACHGYGYCGPDAGVLRIGSSVCYTNHGSQGMGAKDIKCLP